MRQAMQLARNKGKEGNAAWVEEDGEFLYMENFIGKSTIGVSAYIYDLMKVISCFYIIVKT
jgi:hypothetical protein